MRTPLVAGRDFTASDDSNGQRVIVVNRTFAQRYFGSADPVGRRVKLYGEQKYIAGVAADSKWRTLDESRIPRSSYR